MPHVNGLRALAILGVLFYHLQAGYCPAGYFGVDLFLVISGFLLCRSLFKPGAELNFHYGSYLLKKFWRIIPVWFVLALFTCAAALYLMPLERTVDVLKTARYFTTLQADYFIDKSGDYFNIYTQQNPLLHLWYLSITLQLYVVAPLLIIPLARWCSRRAAAILFSLLALLSLAYYVLTTADTLVPESVSSALLKALGTKSSYYHLIPRFWEIAAGALILLLPNFASRPGLRGLLGLIGFAGLLTSFYVYKTGSPAVYLAVFSSMLAIRYADCGLSGWLLNRRSIQALGTISFSLYLWHWPIMVFWKYLCFDNPGIWDEVGMVALSLLLGSLSWYVLERLRYPSLAGWKGAVLRFLPLILLAVAFTAAKISIKEVRKIHAEQADFFNDMITLHVKETDEDVLRGAEILAESGLPDTMMRIGTQEGAPSFMLMGDSHADHMYDALHKLSEQAGIRGIFLNNSVCPYWNLNQPKSRTENCGWNEAIAHALLGYLKQHPEIRYVLIAQSWKTRMVQPKGQDWQGKPLTTEEERLAVTETGLGELCDRLKAQGCEVILLGDTPEFSSPSPMDSWRRSQKLGLPYEERHTTQEEHLRAQAVPHRIHQRLAQEGRALYFDLAPAMMEQGVYPARINGQFLYGDTNHLTNEGEERAISSLIPFLLDLLKK